MDHDVISNDVCCGINILEMVIHVVLEEVLGLIQSKWHFSEAKPTPWSVQCHQQLRMTVHGQGPKSTIGIYFGNCSPF